jgi:hypothetical protein
VKKDFESVKGWFPSVYLTVVTLPWVAWSLAIQLLPDARNALLIVGDVLSVIPPFAFQRGLGAVIAVSPFNDDENLSWSDVWKFETRIFLVIVIMFAVGTWEWMYLYRLTTQRPDRADLEADEEHDILPLLSDDPDIAEEKERSIADGSGINSREVVKAFPMEIREDGEKKRFLKKAVKGISFGIKKNEIYVLLGPNGKWPSVEQRQSNLTNHLCCRRWQDQSNLTNHLCCRRW